MPAYQIVVNGERRDVDAVDDMPLLWVLRDVLNLTGTKYGCGIGQCRACTVHVNGVPAPSCQLRISNLAGAEIVTIEGLPEAEKEPLVAAWAEVDVPQCGYCQPGQIMAAAALLRRAPRPTDADIDGDMSGNLCRCGTYQRIRQAIHRAAELTPR